MAISIRMTRQIPRQNGINPTYEIYPRNRATLYGHNVTFKAAWPSFFSTGYSVKKKEGGRIKRSRSLRKKETTLSGIGPMLRKDQVHWLRSTANRMSESTTCPIHAMLFFRFGLQTAHGTPFAAAYFMTQTVPIITLDLSYNLIYDPDEIGKPPSNRPRRVSRVVKIRNFFSFLTQKVYLTNWNILNLNNANFG